MLVGVEWCCIPASQAPQISDAEALRELECGPRHLFCSQYPATIRPLPAGPQLLVAFEPQNRMRGGILGVFDAADAEASDPNAGRCHQRGRWRH